MSNNLHIKSRLISSSQVNDQLVQDFLEENPDTPQEQAFSRTRAFYKRAYNRHIRQTFLEIYEEVLAVSEEKDDDSIEHNYIIYVDKNHPLNDASQAPIHKKFNLISKYDGIYFVSVYLLAKEVFAAPDQIVRDDIKLSKYFLTFF